MLDNAFKYGEEIKNLFLDTWYEPKYQYYFPNTYREIYKLPETGDWYLHAFVSLNKDRQVIGLISYQIDRECDFAYNLATINFSNDIITFGLDIQQVIDNIFIKFGMNKLEFSVTCGNPTEKNYDRIVSKIGGHILCVRRDRVKLLDGTICNEKLYEVMRTEYLKFKEKRDNNAKKGFSTSK